jgi:hypothetical protein
MNITFPLSASYSSAAGQIAVWLSSPPRSAIPARDAHYTPSAVDEFSEYELYDFPNWDGYGADAIRMATVNAARGFQRLLPRTVPKADIAPGADGTIGFEWRSGPAHHRRFTLVDIGPGDLVTARKIYEDGRVEAFEPTRLETGARALIGELFSE